MAWNRIALCINDVLGILLVIHLFRLRLHRVYFVFSLFILTDLAASSAFAVNAATRWVDYRKLFIAVEVLTWTLTFWMVYALLDALLDKLPGILRFSRYLLNVIFVLALLFAVLSARSSFSSAHVAFDGSTRAWVMAVYVLERVSATVALIVLVAMLGFVLWFPVQLPRNLVFFSFAYIAYFSADTAVSLVREIVSAPVMERLGSVDVLLLCMCFLFLMAKLSRDGERVTVRIGHRWERNQQAKLITQLETLNENLLRSARQSKPASSL